MRLRQIVLAADSIEPWATHLRDIFGLGEPFRDPEVGAFGLENVVFPIGDQFLEIVAPMREGTAGGRFLKRWGEGGYMVILQTEDLNALRQRAETLGVRRVLDIDHDDIAASHLHPRDVGGAILSVDTPVPPESWRWAGPNWEDRRGQGWVAATTGVVLQSDAPDRLAARWGEVLDQTVAEESIALDDARLDFVADTDGRGEGIAAFGLAVTDPGACLKRAEAAGLPVEGSSLILAGCRFDLSLA